MAKSTKSTMQRKTKIEAISIPNADNAKWMGIGFLCAVGIVLVALMLVTHLR